MSDQKVWAEGVYWNAPHPNAPQWIVGRIGIQRDRLIEWLEKQPVSEKGYLSLDVMEKRGTPGEFNVALNTFKPGQKTNTSRPQVQTANTSGDFDDDLPF
jgi:hypothetical protein